MALVLSLAFWALNELPVLPACLPAPAAIGELGPGPGPQGQHRYPGKALHCMGATGPAASVQQQLHVLTTQLDEACLSCPACCLAPLLLWSRHSFWDS